LVEQFALVAEPPTQLRAIGSGCPGVDLEAASHFKQGRGRGFSIVQDSLELTGQLLVAGLLVGRLIMFIALANLFILVRAVGLDDSCRNSQLPVHLGG
jgi:hypothetical protein